MNLTNIQLNELQQIYFKLQIEDLDKHKQTNKQTSQTQTTEPTKQAKKKPKQDNTQAQAARPSYSLSLSPKKIIKRAARTVECGAQHWVAV